MGIHISVLFKNLTPLYSSYLRATAASKKAYVELWHDSYIVWWGEDRFWVPSKSLLYVFRSGGQGIGLVGGEGIRILVVKGGI